MANEDFHWAPEGLAWAAGLFEGEGCIALSKGTKTRPQTQWTLMLASTDLDVLERLQAVVGMGHITGPHDRGHKPFWNWRVSRRSHVILLLEGMAPWLGARRRERAEQCLAACRAADAAVWRCARGHAWDPASNLRRLHDGRRQYLCGVCLDEGHTSLRTTSWVGEVA